MRFPIAAALVAAFFVAAPGLACEGAVQVTERLLARYPDTGLRARLEGDEAARFVARYNAVPPATEHRADLVLIFRDPNYPRANLIRLFTAGCLSGGGVIAAPLVDWLLAQSGAET